MDAYRFDAVIRSLGAAADRRAALRGLAVAVAALAGGGGAARAATCLKNGKTCNPKRSGQCCSGTCAKKGRGHTCRRSPGAQGCTVHDDLCLLHTRRCPGNPDGMCVVLDDGRPFCSLGSFCFDCKTGADCDTTFQAEGGKCIKHCRACAAESSGHACVFPVPISANVAVAAGGSGQGLPR